MVMIMKLRTSFFKNKYCLFFVLATLIAIIIGIFYFLNINSSLTINKVDILNQVKNNSIYHIAFVSIIFFSSFILIGSLIGIFIYFYEIICLTIEAIVLIKLYYFSGLIVFIGILLFKSIYLLLLIYLISRSFKILKYILLRKNYSTDKINIYTKEAIITSLIIITLEIINLFLGYKLISLITFLIK